MFKGKFCWRNCEDESQMIDSYYSDLPPEILIQIFQYLDFYDIHSVRLCCKKWFAVTKLPEFDLKGVFKINSCVLDNNHPAAEVILDKQIERLHLNGVQFGNVDNLFRHIGTSLTALTLKLSPITIALRLTLEYFPYLQTLKVCEIKLPRLFENIEHLPFGNLTVLKELELTANNSSVNKYLLICALRSHTLEGLTIEFCKLEELQVLQVLEKHSSSLKRVDLRFYDGRHLVALQWTMVLSNLNLSELSLQGGFSSQIMIRATEAQRSLRSLDVTGSVAVNDNYLDIVGEKLSGLQRLILAYCGRITDHGVKHLAKLSHLKTLDISCCNQITSKGVRSIIGQPPNWTLMELHLQELAIDEEIICFCAINLPNLRVLNLSGCGRALTNDAIQEIFDCQRKLRELQVDHCEDLSDAGILGLSTGISIQYLRSLQRLSLRGCKMLSDVTLICGLKLPQLKFLDIAYCNAMTNHGLESLVRNCPTLEEICITRTKEMNHEAIEILSVKLGRLRVLTVNNCKDTSHIGATNWTQSGLRTFANEVTLKKYPRLR